MVRVLFVLLFCSITAGNHAERVRSTARVEPAFIENQGQFGADARFGLIGGAFGALCYSDRIVLQLLWESEARPKGRAGVAAEPAMIRGHNLELRLPNSGVPTGVRRLPGLVNFVRGPDAGGTHVGLARFQGVEFAGIQPGRRLRLVATADGVAFEVASANDAIDELELTCSGQDGVTTVPEGVEFRLGGATVLFRGAAAAPESGASKATTVRIAEQHGGSTIAMTAGPDLSYGSYFGGAAADEGWGVTPYWPGTGGTRTLVCGRTASATILPSFPAGSFDTTHNGLFDAFVIKLNGVGNALNYATYIGGNQDDVALGIDVDASGNAYVTGLTFSSGFPATTGAVDTSYNGSGDAFALVLNSSGSALTYSTFLGGSDLDIGYGVAVDGNRSAYVTGETHSANYPIVNPPIHNDKINGNGVADDSDGFVTKVTAGGASLAYSTFITGDRSDACVRIALDSSGQAHVVGNTDSLAIASPDTSGVPGFDPTGVASGDAGFLVSLNAAGSQVLLRTFLEGTANDTANGIGTDGSGNLYVAGYSESSDFPISVGSYDTSQNGNKDGFVCKIALSSGNLLYSTFLGGSAEDIAWDMDVVGADLVVLVGTTSSTNFPTTARAFDTTANLLKDLFVSQMDLSIAGTGALTGSTYVGGRKDDDARAIRYDAHEERVHCTGLTESDPFPTTFGTFDASYAGGIDAFIIRVTVP